MTPNRKTDTDVAVGKAYEEIVAHGEYKCLEFFSLCKLLNRCDLCALHIIQVHIPLAHHCQPKLLHPVCRTLFEVRLLVNQKVNTST